ARSLSPINLGPEWTYAARVRAIMNRYLSRVNDESLLEKLPRLPDAGERHYAGSAACRTCHAAAHATWSASAHAHAYQTLVTAGPDRDPDCVGCHVVWLGSQFGFPTFPTTSLPNV